MKITGLLFAYGLIACLLGYTLGFAHALEMCK